MRPPFPNSPFARVITLAMLVALPASSLRAQSTATPIRRALYIALGGDPAAEKGYANPPFAVTGGIEQARAGSRWAFRLGADYRRQTSSYLSESRGEDFGVALSARYGKASGAFRPYVLGGVGIADLRIRVRNARYYIDPLGVTYPPVSSDASRWNGLLTTGLGTDVTLGRVRLFTEARVNLYPAQLSARPRLESLRWSKGLFLGVKF